MGDIISATIRFERIGGKRAQFLSKAHTLLEQAHTCRGEGDLLLALEMSYQSALRTAGAVVAGSAVAARKRKPKSAWDQLQLVGLEAAVWAAELSQFSTIRSRANSGLDISLSEADLDQFIARVAQFLEEAQQGFSAGASAA
ncbi:SAV_6107 family HEPN domain-containing protein [Corynebacterium crudilactis]|uniref:SAV-6107-like HEPN domain-containing protein n=1 Tax=Corynebacterium crudilactis TaxID=1652495 RepID=A0A172QXC9_9CORY|nr:SAV_6107 family HEPN domain-containing protein [Corynebacterium crudilactis]ANE05369.1 hypothetical protein ccrud_09505 [Corynebacterium crudilactis]